MALRGGGGGGGGSEIYDIMFPVVFTDVHDKSDGRRTSATQCLCCSAATEDTHSMCRETWRLSQRAHRLDGFDASTRTKIILERENLAVT